MRQFTFICTINGLLALLGGAVSCTAASSGHIIGIESGTATFLSSTNVPGIEVKGTSNALSAQAEVAADGKALIVSAIEATVPVRSLVTGMKMRDEHMRKYIFATPDGKEPDLYFTSDSASCPVVGAGLEFGCQISGQLSIRGVSRPLGLTLKVKEQSETGAAFRVAGDGTVKLSDYGIAAPVQFGVKPADQVQIHLDFTGRQKSGSGSGGER